MKRVFDILFSLAALLILSPVFIIVSVLIKFDSKGKIFFSQKRLGKNFEEFSLLKFRTMREDSEKSGMLTIGDRDNRITRVGYYLRKYKLDEIPQFINVLKGDMSIVGPRPEVKKYVDLYTEEQKTILSVKPGITDVASLEFSDESEILAKYADPEQAYVKEIMPAKLSLSIDYLKRRSLVTDAVVIGKTTMKIFSSGMGREICLLSLLVFFLPLYERASAWLAVAMVLLRCFNKNIIADAKVSLRNIVSVLFIAYYMAHLVGTIYSDNLSYAFFDLQIKLPFLLFPLLLTLPLKNASAFKRLKDFFIAGCSVAALLCFLMAGFNFLKNHDPFDFFYIAYSRFLHVTYFSMYLNLCILFLIDSLIQKERKHIGWKLALLIFLFLNVIFLNARTAMFACFITSIIFSIVLGVSRGIFKDVYKGIALMAVFLVAAAVYLNFVYNRFTEVSSLLQKVNTETKADTTRSAESYNSVSTRMELWKASWEVFKENALFGVGTGDIKDVLQKKYTEQKFYFGAEKKFNPHNQFLHTAVMLGLMGVVILVLMLFLLPLRAMKQKNYLYIFFCAVIFFNCLTESILEVQKGVLFFCIFSILLFDLNNEAHQKEFTG